jgi:hypothetical protein
MRGASAPKTRRRAGACAPFRHAAAIICCLRAAADAALRAAAAMIVYAIFIFIIAFIRCCRR